MMLMVRTLVFSIHGVTGDGLSPLYQNGDRLLINRCSYGLRIEGNRLLPYSRLLRQPIERGDIVAFTVPSDSIAGVMIARCAAVPGDTIPYSVGGFYNVDGDYVGGDSQSPTTVPGLITCAKADYYWLESINKQNPADSRSFGFIPESHIIGRVVTVLYNVRGDFQSSSLRP